MAKITKTIRLDSRLFVEFITARTSKYGSPVNNAYKEWNKALEEGIEDIERRIKEKDYTIYDNDPHRQHEKVTSAKLDGDLWLKFRNKVIELHKKDRGFIYIELNLAIRNRIARLKGVDGLAIY